MLKNTLINVVRQSLFFSWVAWFGLPHAHAEALPDIEAHQFKIVPVEKSKTGRVYRFKTDPNELPHTGNIVLIQQDGKPIMAFRILKTDNLTSEFIGKRVRRYDTVSELKMKERYVSIEKLADLVTPPPPETPPPAVAQTSPEMPQAGVAPRPPPEPAPIVAENPPAAAEAPPATEAPPTEAPAPTPEAPPAPEASATAEVPPAPTPPPAEPEPKPMDVEKYDEDLDGSTSPQNLHSGNGDENTKANSDDLQDLDDVKNDFEVDETATLSSFKNLLGVSLGTFRNMSNFAIGNPTTHNGFTAYYSHQVARPAFALGRKPQDALSLEYGFSYYSRINGDAPYESYTLLPLRAEFRYDLFFSEGFSLLIFMGAQYNWIISTENVVLSASGTNANYTRLHGFQPTAGAGFLYNLGPQWYLRADLGLDRMAIGLSVKW